MHLRSYRVIIVIVPSRECRADFNGFSQPSAVLDFSLLTNSDDSKLVGWDLQDRQSRIIGQTYVTRNTSVCRKCRNQIKFTNFNASVYFVPQMPPLEMKRQFNWILCFFLASLFPRNRCCSKVPRWIHTLRYRFLPAASPGELSERGLRKRVGEPTLEQNRFLATRSGPNPAVGKNREELFEILHHDRLTINPLPRRAGKVGQATGWTAF